MSLPSSYKQIISNLSPAPNQLLRAGAPVTFNILKERLKASGTGTGGNSKESQNQSPFVSSPYGNPGFHPQKLGKGTSSETRALKPPKPPEKPLMPYMRYSRKVWDQVKAQNPELKLWEIGKIIGQMWRDLPSDNKTEFIEDYEIEKVEYEKNLKLYYNSPAYLAYMSSKTKGKSGQQSGDDRETYDRSSTGGKHDRRIEIQPAEDEDDADEVYSVKHVSFARYMRNHHLINEIFSDSVVPDVRSVVTASRMQNFYWKIQSLQAHQKKMESEVQQLVEKFDSTKRKFNEASEAFQEEIRKYCKRAVDEEFFNTLVEKECERLRKERSAENNHPVDELKDVGRESLHNPLQSASESISTVLNSSSDSEQSSTGKNDGSMNKVSEDDGSSIPTLPVIDGLAGTVQSRYHQTNSNPASPTSGYVQSSPQMTLNRMLPPLLQPSFTQRPFFANTRPQYTYAGGIPQFNTHQPSQTYYPSSYQCQTQGLSIPRTTLPFGPSLDTQTVISSDLKIDKDDAFGALCSE